MRRERLQVEDLELVTEDAHVPRVGHLDEVEALHAREADPQVAPDVVGARVQTQRLQIALGGLLVVAQISVADAKVQPSARVARLDLQRSVGHNKGKQSAS